MVQNDFLVWETSLSLPIIPDSKCQALKWPIEMIKNIGHLSICALPELQNFFVALSLLKTGKYPKRICHLT